jgi:hypothetical protein
MLIGRLWFKRRRPDGLALFARGARWRGVLGTLGLATIFAACGYDTWKSDVYLPAIGIRAPRVFASMLETPGAATITQHTTLRVAFEVAVDDLEVVVEFSDDKTQRFTSGHHGVMVQLAAQPGTYEWRAMLKGEHVASGEVTLAANQLAVIKVPRPKLIQLIAGWWETGDTGDQYEFTGNPNGFSRRDR